jgi:predicted DNA-binding transcriptional regulator AlpA
MSARDHAELQAQISTILRALEQLTQANAAPDQSQTISQFCAAEQISRAFFYDLVKQGRGPRLMRLANGCIRVSAEARRDWRRAREAETAAAGAVPPDA